MLRYSVFAIFVVTAAAEVGVFEDGPCPPIKTKTDFDFDSYSGTWYEIARFPNAGEEGDKGRCTTAEYHVRELRGKVKNSHVVDGLKTYIEGDITLIGPAKIMLTYTFGDEAKNSYLNILDTDYINYSVGYSCRYFKETKKRQVFSWIFSRSKSLEGSVKTSVKKFLAKNSKIIDQSQYVYNDHSDETCTAKTSKRITEFLKEVHTNIIE